MALRLEVGAPGAARPELAAHLAAQRAANAWWWATAGSMGLPNALDVLLDAAARLREAPFAFVLVGQGHEAERLADGPGACQRHLFPCHPQGPDPDPAGRFTSPIGWQRTPIYRFGIAPNKLIDYTRWPAAPSCTRSMRATTRCATPAAA